MSDPDLLEKADFIHLQVSTKPSLFATPVPAMTVLKDACDEFRSALSSANSGDTAMISQKNVYRNGLVDILHQLSNYVQLTANGDKNIVVQAGMNDVKPSAVRQLGEATIKKAEYTGTSGEIMLTSNCPNGKAFVGQYTTDAELKEGSWKGTTPVSRRKCKIIGLTPGTTYYLRVMVTGTNGQVTYSAVQSKMAV